MGVRGVVPPGESCENKVPGEGRLMVRGGGAVSELSMETPDEDAAEQAREVPEDGDAELAEVPFEADEADAAEQIRDAGYDDEDYR
jgi:hypothetical protein